MLRVGLSGGIGSGKSTVSARLAELGAVVVDADKVAREVVEPGTPALAEIAERFGAGVLTAAGALDRPALGALVFEDTQARRDLEAITHPRIQARSAELFAAAPADAVVVHDIPLLVEAGRVADYALTVIVDVPEQERLRRLVQSRGMPSGQARARIAAQADDGQRRAAADVLLDNSGSVDSLHVRVDALWRERLVPFERNLRTGTPVRRPEELAVVDPDPDWPARAARLLARVRRALGARALRVDHIGSTSVPGLQAKDVIDLQVVVEDLEVLEDPATRAELAKVGFLVPDRVWHDHDHETRREGAPAVPLWPKKILATGDPACVVHCHVRPAASPAWRLALLYRDWWRAEPAERNVYADLKRTLTARGLTSSEYAEAKEPWFARAAGRAHAWARRTGWQPGSA
ncbi:dephospho-CoA kinase [Ornithinimicrobium pratense]|uniref:Dephospho-CoA kinase n=1 Tax=Ornithinimicrobium pratense TaxID=2593973 RepID=A0A5J6V4X2_9MICO|nr:dephospho-CoA kinase [Ornithinimicrobium pratense]QFG68122.1 dephospho-CoA kinase [Ornithinimicrobium pratense]